MDTSPSLEARSLQTKVTITRDQLVFSLVEATFKAEVEDRQLGFKHPMLHFCMFERNMNQAVKYSVFPVKPLLPGGRSSG